MSTQEGSNIDVSALRAKISDLQERLLSKHPTMPTLLAEIHRTLRTYPEQVTLLAEDEIRVIVNGLEAQTQTHLVTVTTKSSKSPAATKSIASKLANLGADAV